MNEKIKPIIAEMKETLNKYPDRQLEILLYVFGRDNLMRIINEPTYEQLQQENQQLKEKDLIIAMELEKLQTENQQLKDKLKWYEKENTHNQEIIIKQESTLKKIREYTEELKPHWLGNDLVLKIIDDLLQIIDKSLKKIKE